MVTLELEGRDPVAVAPFKLAQLRAAAPFVDRLNELVQATSKLKTESKVPTLEATMELLHVTVQIIAVGTAKADPSLTADALEEIVGMDHLASLQLAVFELLAQSGLGPNKGEASAPVEEPAGAEV
jgi:hypothetical protein